MTGTIRPQRAGARLVRRLLLFIVLAGACVLPLGAGTASGSQSPTPPMKIVDSVPAASIDLDPATSWFQDTWTIEYATCLKLVNYADVSGGAGTQPQLEAADSVFVLRVRT